MKQRISSAVWVLVFALIGLGFAVAPHINPPDNIVAEKAEPSYVDRLIKFCLKSKNQNSKLCVVKNPRTDEEVKEAIEDSVRQEIQQDGGSGTDKPIVIESETKRFTEEIRTNTERVNNDTRTVPTTPPDPDPEPTQQVVDIPKIEVPEIPDVPKMDIPEVEIPVVQDPLDNLPKIASE